MTFAVNVQGGTGAGSKRPKLPAYTIPWACTCPTAGTISVDHPKLNPGYLKRCIDCGTERPG